MRKGTSYKWVLGLGGRLGSWGRREGEERVMVRILEDGWGWRGEMGEGISGKLDSE